MINKKGDVPKSLRMAFIDNFNSQFCSKSDYQARHQNKQNCIHI